MKRVVAITTVILGSVLVSCSSPRKTATSGEAKKVSKKIACSEQITESTQPHLDWIIEENSALDNLTSLARPSSFKLYSLDSVQARSFFRAAKSTNESKPVVNAVLPLPAPLECKIFALRESQAMAKKLKEKYPDMVSLEGSETGGQSSARLEYDGRKVKGQVLLNNQVYFISPVLNNSKYYYMVYSRSDSKEKKEPYERAQPERAVDR